MLERMTFSDIWKRRFSEKRIYPITETIAVTEKASHRRIRAKKKSKRKRDKSIKHLKTLGIYLHGLSDARVVGSRHAINTIQPNKRNGVIGACTEIPPNHQGGGGIEAEDGVWRADLVELRVKEASNEGEVDHLPIQEGDPSITGNLGIKLPLIVLEITMTNFEDQGFISRERKGLTDKTITAVN